MTRSIAIVVALAGSLACAVQAQEKPRDKPKLKVEFRWAEEKPTEGLTENKGVDLSCTDKKAYLHTKPILTNPDVADTRLIKANSSPEQLYIIHVSLTREAAARMAESSVKNLDKPLVVLVEGKIVAAMTPKAQLSDFVLITGFFPRGEAERIATGIKVKSAAEGQEPPAKPKAKVEFRWVETKRVEGLTEDKGFQSSCDPKDIVYPHKKPALVLTTAEVREAHLTEHDFSKSGLGVHYMVTIHLKEAARNKLAATVEGKEMRLLTVVVDGKYWGVYRYEKDRDKQFVPDAARAETFAPGVGFFSSKAEAERLVTALK